jgi:hypothetical protein
MHWHWRVLCSSRVAARSGTPLCYDCCLSGPAACKPLIEYLTYERVFWFRGSLKQVCVARGWRRGHTEAPMVNVTKIKVKICVSVVRSLYEMNSCRGRFRPHVTSSKLLDEFRLNLVLRVYTENCRENSVLVFRILLKKVKVRLSLCLTKHHSIKAYWWMEVYLHAFLALALDGGEWSASRPSRFTPRERAPGTHWIGGWVGPRTVLDAVVKRKIPSLHRESNPRTSIVQPIASRYTDWAITALRRILLG